MILPSLSNYTRDHAWTDKVLRARLGRGGNGLPAGARFTRAIEYRGEQNAQPQPRPERHPQRVYPGVALEPRFAIGKLRLGQRSAVDAFEHPQAELNHQRPLRAARAADGGRHGGGNASAVEDMRGQRAPPEPRKIDPGRGHLVSRSSEEPARAGTARISQHGSGRKCDGAPRFVNRM